MESDAFDPYRKWLGIPECDRPPTHYQLLGISPDEKDREVIEAAVIRQSTFVRNFQTGKRAEHATKLLNEIAAAQVCLTDLAKRAQYDAELKRKQPAATPPRTASGAPSNPASFALSQAPPARDASPPLRPPRVVQSAAYRPPPPPNARRPAPVQRGSAPRAARVAQAEPLDGLLAANLPPVNSLRPRPTRTPAYYWQVPLVLGSVAAVAVIAIAAIFLSRRTGPVVPVAMEPVAPNQPSVAQSGSPQGVPGNPAANSIVPGLPSTSSSFPPYTGAPSPPSDQSGSDRFFDELTEKLAGQDTLNPRNPRGSRPPSTIPGSDSDQPPHESRDERPSKVRRPTKSPGIPTMDGPDELPGLDVPGFDSQVFFAEGTSPFVAINGVVWNMATRAQTGRTGAARSDLKGFGTLATLSQDGSFFAHASNFGGDGIEVRSCGDGQIHKTLSFKKSGIQVKFIGFSEQDRLISAAAWLNDSRVQVWNLAKGEMVKEFKTPGIDFDKSALSPDGKHFAARAKNQVVIYNVKTGKVAATMDTSLSSSGRRLEALRFGADGQELAALDDGGLRLLVWGSDAKLVFQAQTRLGDEYAWQPEFGYEGPPIEWLPDGSGWLLYGRYLLDRKSYRVVWKLQSTSEKRFRFLDQQTLAVVRGGRFGGKLVGIRIPWDSITAELADKESKHENLPFVHSLQ